MGICKLQNNVKKKNEIFSSNVHEPMGMEITDPYFGAAFLFLFFFPSTYAIVENCNITITKLSRQHLFLLLAKNQLACNFVRAFSHLRFMVSNIFNLQYNRRKKKKSNNCSKIAGERIESNDIEKAQRHPNQQLAT